MSVFSVPVTIGVDEERIAKEIEANVEEQVVNRITTEVKNIMFRKTGWDNYDKEPLRNMITDEVEKIVMDYKENIIQLAAEILADKLSRMKAVKEAAVNVAKEV